MAGCRLQQPRAEQLDRRGNPEEERELDAAAPGAETLLACVELNWPRLLADEGWDWREPA